MATSNIQYCTHRDIKDTYPAINDSGDSKRPIYGWVKEKDDFDGTSDLWYASGTGLITQLFKDGEEVHKITFPTTQTTLLNGAYSDGGYGYSVDSVTGFEAGDIIKVDNHYSILSGVTGDPPSIAINAPGLAIFNTLSVDHADDSKVYLVVDESEYDTQSGYWFVYDSDMDMCMLAIPDDTDPRDMLVESGEDYATLITRVAKRASRLIDSKIGYRVTDTQIKDREGNYPDIIVRAASLQSVILLLTSEDPTNPIIEPFKEELNEIVEGINSGTIVILGNQRTMDAAKGIIREVSVDSSSDLLPVELKGYYNGTTYELLKVYIDSGEGGVIGTTKMTVKGKSSTSLKSETLIDSEIITGDYQSLGVSSMSIRWSGDNDAAITTASDEYEIELFGHSLDSSTPGQVGNIKMTRR